MEERKEQKREEEEAKRRKRKRRGALQIEEDSRQKCCDVLWSSVLIDIVNRRVKIFNLVFVVPVIWILAVMASFAIVYVKLPSDLVLNALANLGVGWAKRWMDFVKESKIGKLLELSGQTETQNRIMKLFEQLGEALPQIGLNITFYRNNT